LIRFLWQLTYYSFYLNTDGGKTKGQYDEWIIKPLHPYRLSTRKQEIAAHAKSPSGRLGFAHPLVKKKNTGDRTKQKRLYKTEFEKKEVWHTLSICCVHVLLHETHPCDLNTKKKTFWRNIDINLYCIRRPGKVALGATFFPNQRNKSFIIMVEKVKIMIF